MQFLDITASLEDASHQMFPVSVTEHKKMNWEKKKKKLSRAECPSFYEATQIIAVSLSWVKFSSGWSTSSY